MLKGQRTGVRVDRRAFLGWGAALGSTLGLLRARKASAHALPPGSFDSPAYSRVLAAEAGYHAVFQSPHIEASVRAGDNLEHLLLAQANNWLNGFQFSYNVRPEDLHLVSATYASANLLTYDDTVWQKYRLGEKYGVVDPKTGQSAVRNPFWPSRNGPGASTDPNNPKSTYRDNGIEALQRRGVLFLT
jgi:hypothetical protein